MKNSKDISKYPISSPKMFFPPIKGDRIICNGINYYIGAQIGEGVFGAVYECTDDWSNQLVAKVLKPSNGSYEEVRILWEYEFSKLLELRHPNITYLHQAFEYRDTFYLIIERCSSDLNYLINWEDMNSNNWLPYIARDILHGLDFIHKSGYVHKDLHPGNIFISHHYDFMVPGKLPVWSFKIGDLGISRLEGDIRIFNTILAQWMLPPEFLNSKFGIVGKQTDIYHTGLLLLSILLKETPSFTHEQILEGVPRKIAEERQNPYSHAIAKALRRNTKYRTNSAIEMWQDIFNVIPR